MYFLFKMGIFHCYVCLPEGMGKWRSLVLWICYSKWNTLRDEHISILGEKRGEPKSYVYIYTYLEPTSELFCLKANRFLPLKNKAEIPSKTRGPIWWNQVYNGYFNHGFCLFSPSRIHQGWSSSSSCFLESRVSEPAPWLMWFSSWIVSWNPTVSRVVKKPDRKKFIPMGSIRLVYLPT